MPEDLAAFLGQQRLSLKSASDEDFHQAVAKTVDSGSKQRTSVLASLFALSPFRKRRLNLSDVSEG